MYNSCKKKTTINSINQKKYNLVFYYLIYGFGIFYHIYKQIPNTLYIYKAILAFFMNFYLIITFGTENAIVFSQIENKKYIYNKGRKIYENFQKI